MKANTAAAGHEAFGRCPRFGTKWDHTSIPVSSAPTGRRGQDRLRRPQKCLNCGPRRRPRLPLWNPDRGSWKYSCIQIIASQDATVAAAQGARWTMERRKAPFGPARCDRKASVEPIPQDEERPQLSSFGRGRWRAMTAVCLQEASGVRVNVDCGQVSGAAQMCIPEPRGSVAARRRAALLGNRLTVGQRILIP